MKCAIIITNELKQVMLSPETEMERKALSMITEEDDISIEIKEGTLYDDPPRSARGYEVSQSRGGYLRAYSKDSAVMLVLRPKSGKMSDDTMENT